MIKDKIVKLRFRRYFDEQALWVIVGKVLEFGDSWVKIEGKGICIMKGHVIPCDVDKENKILLIPRDNIAHIRILPDDFDLGNIKAIK